MNMNMNYSYLSASPSNDLNPPVFQFGKRLTFFGCTLRRSEYRNLPERSLVFDQCFDYVASYGACGPEDEDVFWYIACHTYCGDGGSKFKSGTEQPLRR